MDLIFGLIWFMLPPGFANMVPPFGSILFPNLDFPMDFGKTWNGKRIFGPHKTMRGLIMGTLLSGLVFFLQKQSFIESEFIRQVSLWDYQNIPWFYGFFVGFGALMADALKSTFKRQCGIDSGKSWFPWDQIDWIFGTIFVSVFFFKITWVQIVVFILMGIISHLLFKVFGYVLKINQTPI